MRAMGVDLLLTAPIVEELAADHVAEGRAAAWLTADGAFRTCFHDAAAELVHHDLEVVRPGVTGVGERHHLLLVGSREADVHAFAQRLHGQGWHELARSRPGRATSGGYFLALVERLSPA